MPLHVPAPHLLADSADFEGAEFVRLDQGHDGRGIPGCYGVEVGVEVAVPGTAPARSLSLAGCERDPDPSLTGTGLDLGDLERVGVAGAD